MICGGLLRRFLDPYQSDDPGIILRGVPVTSNRSPRQFYAFGTRCGITKFIDIGYKIRGFARPCVSDITL